MVSAGSQAFERFYMGQSGCRVSLKRGMLVYTHVYENMCVYIHTYIYVYRCTVHLYAHKLRICSCYVRILVAGDGWKEFRSWLGSKCSSGLA